MNNIIVKRPEDTVVVNIFKDKLTDKWCFVNLTKGHVCTCRFSTKLAALRDLEEQRKQGKVIDWYWEKD